MIQKDSNTNYNTNLASEYLIMSLLHRIGHEAYLSIGNKKGVDIIVKTNLENICIIEVKGVNKQNDWLIGNSGKLPNAPNLFYALVCFNGEINNPTSMPKFWIIPSVILANENEHKVAKNGKTVFLSNKQIREKYLQYYNSFIFFNEFVEQN